MARVSVFKNNFTSGVLDPRLKSRADIQHYANGVEIGDNMVILPFGGTRRRGGLKYVYEIPAAVAGNGQLMAFSYNSTDVQYLLAFVEQRIYFFRNGAIITNINGSGNDYLVSPYPIAVARFLRTAQTADSMVIVHEDYAPRLLVRGATDATWTLSTITFDFIPQIDFNDASSPAPTSEVQDVTFTTVSVGNQFKLDLEGVVTEAITYDTVTATTANRIQKALAKLWNTADGDITVAFTAGTTYRVTFRNGAARNYDTMTGYTVVGTGTIAVAAITNGVPRTENAWSATRGWPRSVTFYEGRMVFGGSKSRPQTVFLSASTALFNFNIGEGLDDDAIMKTLDTDQANKIINIIPGRHLQIYTEGGEFFVPDFPITPENSNFRTQTTYGSSRVRPLQAEGATLFLDQFGRGLYQFVYSDVEAAYGASSLSRLSANLLNTPVDMAVQKSLNDESTNYIYLINTDGSVALLNTLRTEEISAWTPWDTEGQFLSVSVLGEDVYFLVRRVNGAGANAWYVELLDEDAYLDSSVLKAGGSTVVNIANVRYQETSLGSNNYQRLIDTAAAHGLTVGTIVVVAAVNGSQHYDINGTWTVEAVSDTDTVRLGANVFGPIKGSYVSGGTLTYGSSTTVTGLSHLNGVLCRVRADGAILANKTPSGGSITIEVTATIVEVGRWFQPRVKLMPPAVSLSDGPTQMRRSRLGKVKVNVRQTQGVLVNGYPIPERYLNADPMDTAPAALTGVLEIRLAGWSLLPAVDLTQEHPLPLTLLAVEYEGGVS